MNENKNYVAYEYATIGTKAAYVDLYTDSMPAFGWQLAEKNQGLDGVTLKFKRDAEISNKSNLNLLQRRFEAEVETIRLAEVSKTSLANLVSIATGIVGTGFLAGSVFCVTAATPIIVPTVILGAIGIVGWIAPYFLYQAIKRKKTKSIAPLTAQCRETVYNICREARDSF